MQPEETAALAELAGDVAAGTTDRVRDIHAGVSRRVFNMVGPAALPARIVHDGIAGLAYTGAREATRVAVSAGVFAARVGQRPDRASMHDTARGRRLLGALNGAVGDRLERRDSVLALPMTVRAGSRDVELTEDGLRGAFPSGGGRLVVFLHGLGQTDEAWLTGAEREVPYGFRLQAELGYAPLYIRYNSGRHISDNGRELARLLDRIVDQWPSTVGEIALVGHAMGGLLARAACHYGAGRAWAGHVRHVFMLGAPHNGAPLEQLTGATGSLLSRLPETRAVAKAIEQRSAGIKDLRRGYIVEEDWREESPTAREIPYLEGAKHYFVSAAPGAPTALLVTRGSAWGRRRREPVRFPATQYAEIAGVGHFELLNHPAVYAQIRRWLTIRPALPAPVRALPAPGGDQRP